MKGTSQQTQEDDPFGGSLLGPWRAQTRDKCPKIVRTTGMICIPLYSYKLNYTMEFVMEFMMYTYVYIDSNILKSLNRLSSISLTPIFRIRI